MRRLHLGALALGLTLLGAVGCERKLEARSQPAQGAAAEAAQTTRQAATGQVALCEHEVPAELCTRCNPDLAEVFKDQGDWCEEHGVPESQCLQCNPGLTFTATATTPADWCKEHAVPESKCTKCNPKLVAKFIAEGDYCREHGFPQSVCPYCNPELVKAAGASPPVFPEPGTRVRLASAQTAKEAGIETRPVDRRPVARTLDVIGELTFDQNRLAQLSARGEALVLEVKVDVGDDVKAGQPLMVLASASVGTAQAQSSAARARVVAAQAAVQRERGLVEKGISPRKSLEEAEAQLAQAQAELDAARSGLTAAGAGASSEGGRYVLTAPFAGTVVQRDAVIGKSVSAEQVVLQLADLSTMWADLKVPEADASLVKAGQPVRLTFEGTRLPPREATITRVGNAVDRATRTVGVRVELPNPGRALKAGTFVRASISLEGEQDALVVPKDALQRAEGRTFVFVKTGDGLYEPAVVQTGVEADGRVEVLEGLQPGAQVVTTGAFLLKTEIMKESIGAGCCEVGGESSGD